MLFLVVPPLRIVAVPTCASCPCRWFSNPSRCILPGVCANVMFHAKWLALEAIRDTTISAIPVNPSMDDLIVALSASYGIAPVVSPFSFNRNVPPNGNAPSCVVTAVILAFFPLRSVVSACSSGTSPILLSNVTCHTNAPDVLGPSRVTALTPTPDNAVNLSFTADADASCGMLAVDFVSHV